MATHLPRWLGGHSGKGHGIPCLKCNGSYNAVVDSRPVRNTLGGIELSRPMIRRRRICSGCGHRVTTLEVVFAEGYAPGSAAAEFDALLDELDRFKAAMAMFYGK